MTLYRIIKALQTASGSNAKQAILEQNKDNELLKAYLKAVMDPSISYYQKAVPKHGAPSGRQTAFDMLDILHAVETFAKRMVTGDLAKRTMQKWLEDQNSVEDQELCTMLIARSIGSSIGDTMILKTWPSLYLVPAYMRCSLANEKTLKPFNTGETFTCQKKADGQYCSLYVKEHKAYTRAGNSYPLWLVEKLLLGAGNKDNNVLLGEVLVRPTGSDTELPRQVANGLINSALKGADEDDFKQYVFFMECWDMLPKGDFEAGHCKTQYKKRFEDMKNVVEWDLLNVRVIPTYFVNTLDEAYAINNRHLLEGFEGSVIKTLSHEWKNHTSPFNVKLKVAFEIDLEIIGMKEGTGKAKNMLGALTVQSSDGLLQCDVGTGFSDLTRQQFWDGRDELYGMIVSIKANDILANRANKNMSLFLPVFVEVRVDKKIADSYDECLAQLDSAKGLK